jgi:hypothetical protein
LYVPIGFSGAVRAAGCFEDGVAVAPEVGKEVALPGTNTGLLPFMGIKGMLAETMEAEKAKCTHRQRKVKVGEGQAKPYNVIAASCRIATHLPPALPHGIAILLSAFLLLYRDNAPIFTHATRIWVIGCESLGDSLLQNASGRTFQFRML